MALRLRSMARVSVKLMNVIFHNRQGNMNHRLSCVCRLRYRYGKTCNYTHFSCDFGIVSNHLTNNCEIRFDNKFRTNEWMGFYESFTIPWVKGVSVRMKVTNNCLLSHLINFHSTEKDNVLNKLWFISIKNRRQCFWLICF